MIQVNFKVNDKIKQDFKNFSFVKEDNKNFCLMLNPYTIITDCGMMTKDLQKEDVIKDKDGIILKIMDFGSSGLFGKDNWSWIWIYFYSVNSNFN